MNDALNRLSSHDLRLISSALRSGRISLPSSAIQVSRFVGGEACHAVVQRLGELSTMGFGAEQIATLIDTLLVERELYRNAEGNKIDLVTTGPEAPGTSNRDTSVVVREMFAHASRTVMVVGYAIYQGQKVFESLARRMDELPELKVELYLNIARADHDSTKSEILVSRFIERFKSQQWPSTLDYRSFTTILEASPTTARSDHHYMRSALLLMKGTCSFRRQTSLKQDKRETSRSVCGSRMLG